MLKGLIVEDDEHLNGSIKEILSALLETEQAFDGETGLYMAEQNIYDLIILDLMMPGMDGYSVLKELRSAKVETPVLILTAKDGIDDKVHGFKNGADDYLTKPFHREELKMRVQALLKRSSGLYQENMLNFHDLSLNLQNHAVTVQGEALGISGKEFDILAYLLQNPNIIITKEQIFDRIWGFDSETSMTVVEVYMSNLRKKLKPTGYDKWITTIRHVGYMLEVEA